MHTHDSATHILLLMLSHTHDSAMHILLLMLSLPTMGANYLSIP